MTDFLFDIYCHSKDIADFPVLQKQTGTRTLMLQCNICSIPYPLDDQAWTGMYTLVVPS